MLKTTEDCFATGCCNVVGYNCFTTKPEQARCMHNCTPSKFQREESDVSSVVGAEVGSGMMTIAVTPLADDWHFAKRKVSGTWANAGVFTQI